MPDPGAWAIIVPATITPTVVAGYAYFQQRFMRREAERDELRVVVDEAARSLGDMLESLVPYRRGWQTSGMVAPKVSEEAERYMHAVRHATDRLTVRVGRDAPMTEAHRLAGLALFEYYATLRHGIASATPYPGNGNVERLRDHAQQRRETFLRAAEEVVGLDVYRFGSPLYPSLPLPRGRVN